MNQSKFIIKNFGNSAVIGESEIGLPSPILFDPHFPIRQNKPPVSLVTGSPGSGKTFLLLLLAAQASVMGKRNFAIDPKGDFLALLSLQRMGLVEKVSVWSAFTSAENAEVNEANYGMLDPMNLTNEIDENIALTIDVIKDLVPNLTTKQSNALIPIVQDVANLSKPSMAKVIRYLQQEPDDDIRNMGVQLEAYSRMPVSKIITAEGQGENPFDKNDGTMIISLLGLDLPSADISEDKYSMNERISAVIMRLITKLVLESMKKQSKRVRKTLFIDEAWVVFANSAGRSLINQTALLGRSLNMATILATQSPRHLKPKDGESTGTLDSTISTRFAFRSDSDEDNLTNRAAMRLPENESWEKVFPKLSTGQCVLRDSQGQLAIVRIMANDKWAEAFSTTPDPKSK